MNGRKHERAWSSRSRLCRLAALSAFAAALSGCGEDPFTNFMRNCDAPDDTRPFTFESGGVSLSGFIDPPESPGPHPAILLIHGDGPTDVTDGGGDFEVLRDAFRRAGVASVVWDKAGSGCSSGRYRGIADLYLRSDEVLAAVDALRAREDIDAERIGAWATSQGGWIAPMAAARSESLAYLIIVGGPAHDPIRQNLYLIGKNLELEGYPAAEAEALVAELEKALTLMADQAPYEEYLAAIEPLAQHPFLAELARLGSDLHPSERRYAELQESGVLDVSAEVFLPAVDVPLLAIWGDLDSLVDWREAARVYREAAAASGNSELTVRVFEGADHGLCQAQTGSLEERRASERCELADGYLDTMTMWLRGHGFAEPEPPAQSSAGGLIGFFRGGDRR